MERSARLAHAALAWLFVAGICVQVFLAGLSIFSDSATWATHRSFGYTVMGLLVLLVVLSAVVARQPRGRIGWTLLLLLDYVVQTILPNFRTSAPAISALHPVNALILFVLAVAVARWASTDVRSQAAALGGSSQ
jgi:uncharacterized membrane protein